MSGKSIDYSTTEVSFYKIVCNDLDNSYCYVGHTANFTERKAHHKKVFNGDNYRGSHLKIYQTIRSNGGFSNWNMIEIEKYPCLDSNEAWKRERYHYELLGARKQQLRIIIIKRSPKKGFALICINY